MEEKNNEIDLLELSRNIMVRVYHYSIRRYKLLGIFAAFGLVIGLIICLELSSNNKEEHVNRIIATSYIVPPEIIIDIINSLDELNSTDKVLTSKVLNVSIEEANSFIGISADTIQKIQNVQTIQAIQYGLNLPSGKTVLLKDEPIKPIEINVKFSKSIDLKHFTKCINNYIDSSLYVKNELRFEKNRSLAMLHKYNQEIKNLDSLQNSILHLSHESSGSNQEKLLILSDKSDGFFHNDIINLEASRQQELKRLDRITGLYIIDQKTGLHKEKISFIKTILKYVAICFGIGFFITLILEYIILVKNIEKKVKVNK